MLKTLQQYCDAGYKDPVRQCRKNEAVENGLIRLYSSVELNSNSQ